MAEEKTVVEVDAIKAMANDALIRMQTGKETKADIENWKRVLEVHPNVWRATGDMATVTGAKLIEDAAGQNRILRMSMAYGCERIKKALGYDESPMLEQLLIDAVVLSWLRWSLTEYRHTENMKTGQTIIQGDYWDRHLNAAQRRYLRALTALARIRKMDLPPIQINIGDRQVNIAGMG